jgi:hypothetical protein
MDPTHAPTIDQGCQNGRPMVKFTVLTSARVHVYPADAFLPANRFLPSETTVKNTSAQTHQRIHAGKNPSA